MACIRKRQGKYQVQIRKQGYFFSKTFLNYKDALKWSSYHENKINLGFELELVDKKISLSDLLLRYLNEITPTKKGRLQETVRIKRLLREPICQKKIYMLRTRDFVEFKNKRILDGNRACRYDLTLLHHMYNVAIKQWNYPINSNPVSNVPKPKENPPRNRRLSDNELKYILNENFKNLEMKKIILIAIETGMRRGEILGLKPENLKENFVYLHDTKNGSPRMIPLTLKAKEVLKSCSLPFKTSCNALRKSWNRMLKRAGIDDLHFHDLRHEAISKFFERGLTIPEVSLISGHKDVKQLMRYTHLKPENLLPKIQSF